MGANVVPAETARPGQRGAPLATAREVWGLRPRERYGVSVRYPFGIRSAAWWASVDLTRDVPWLNPLKKRQMRSISVSGFLETPLAGGAKDRSRILHLECYGNGIDEEDAEAGLKPLV